MIKVERCIICGRQNMQDQTCEIAPFLRHRAHISEKRAELMHCRVCDLRFFNPRLETLETDRLYTGYRNADYTTERTFFEPDYPDRIKRQIDPNSTFHQQRIADLGLFLKDLDPRLILDYGGDGSMLRKLFPKSVVRPYDMGLPYPTNRFDLVVCSHVLEHISFPKTFISGLVERVSRSGCLYLEVPLARPMNPNRAPIMHEHVTFFSVRAFINMLVVTGLLAKRIMADENIHALLTH